MYYNCRKALNEKHHFSVIFNENKLKITVLIEKVRRVQICKYFLRLYPFSNLNAIKTDGSVLKSTATFVAGPKFQECFFKKTDPYINTLPRIRFSISGARGLQRLSVFEILQYTRMGK